MTSRAGLFVLVATLAGAPTVRGDQAGVNAVLRRLRLPTAATSPRHTLSPEGALALKGKLQAFRAQAAGRGGVPARGLSAALRGAGPLRPAGLALSPRERGFLSTLALGQRYPSGAVALSPHRYQELVGHAAAPLNAVLERELGLERSPFRRRIAVVEGPAARGFDAGAAVDAIVVHRDVVDTAPALSGILGRSATGSALLGHLRDALAAPTPPAGDGTHVTQIIGGMIAHEMTHALERHATSVLRTQAKERRADAGGAQLAVRAGLSPRAAAVPLLYLALIEAREGGAPAPRGPRDSHPAPLARYRAIHTAFSRAGDRLSDSQRAELARMPTPDEAESFVAGAWR